MLQLFLLYKMFPVQLSGGQSETSSHWAPHTSFTQYMFAGGAGQLGGLLVHAHALPQVFGTEFVTVVESRTWSVSYSFSFRPEHSSSKFTEQLLGRQSALVEHPAPHLSFTHEYVNGSWTHAQLVQFPYESLAANCPPRQFSVVWLHWTLLAPEGSHCSVPSVLLSPQTVITDHVPEPSLFSEQG